MLILSRNVGETICIGDDITVTVLKSAGHQIRLGVNAPDDVVIVREELLNNHLCRKGNGSYERRIAVASDSF